MVKTKLNGRPKKQRNTSINSAYSKELPPTHWAYSVAVFSGKNKATAQESKK